MVTAPPGDRRGSAPGMTAGQKRYVPAPLSIRVQRKWEHLELALTASQLSAGRDHGNQQPHAACSEMTVTLLIWCQPCLSESERRGEEWRPLGAAPHHCWGAAQPKLPRSPGESQSPGSGSRVLHHCLPVARGTRGEGRALQGTLLLPARLAWAHLRRCCGVSC